MAPVTKKNARPIFKTSSPFTETKWPQIAQDDQEIIIDLVCNLLTPLGDHRKTHIHPSQGKKRKRTTSTSAESPTTPPPPPALHSHILIGLNSITRRLEARAALTSPPALHPPSHENEPNDESKTTTTTTTTTTENKQPPENPPSLIFLTTPHPPSSPLYTHIPTLIHLANLPLHSPPPPQSSSFSSSSSPVPSHQPTLLIPLPSSTDTLFAKALHIPRVGALGIHANAPGVKALEEFVRKTVGVTECAWISEAGSGVWKGVEVEG